MALRSKHRLVALGVVAAFITLVASAVLVRSGATHLGGPRLVSVEPLPEMDGALCPLEPAGATMALSEALLQRQGDRPAAATRPAEQDRAPLRTIRDPNPAFSAIAVEPETNMLVVTDENLFQVLEYDRRENTPAAARMTEPKRMIGGDLTKAEMMCGVYIDPKTLDTYIVNNDTQNWLAVFSKNAKGNVAPDRVLATPHGTFGISVDESRQEMYLTVEHQNSVVVYRKTAEGNDKPLRQIVGADTHLEDPHGIAVDTKRKLMFVSNHGNVNFRQPGKDPESMGPEIPGSGKFEPPSITVYTLEAGGNVKPLRIIAGAKTRLNWPMQMAVDEERGELYVANDMDQSVVVFGAEDDGNAAPRRVIRGPKTLLRNPTGVSLDQKNKELWVSSMGSHAALAFPLSADGDLAPVRTIRGGPADELGLMIGNPGGVGYDTKRDQILVPN
jgi:6-phosphogluconolactonase (cycloisomerase 2 family)